MTDVNQKRAAAGRRGGQSTLAKHGKEHFQKIGRAGARVFHERYKLEPVFQNDFAIVNRSTGETVAFLNGRP